MNPPRMPHVHFRSMDLSRKKAKRFFMESSILAEERQILILDYGSSHKKDDTIIQLKILVQAETNF